VKTSKLVEMLLEAQAIGTHACASADLNAAADHDVVKVLLEEEAVTNTPICEAGSACAEICVLCRQSRGSGTLRTVLNGKLHGCTDRDQ
jgi:hypothetical protein